MRLDVGCRVFVCVCLDGRVIGGEQRRSKRRRRVVVAARPRCRDVASPLFLRPTPGTREDDARFFRVLIFTKTYFVCVYAVPHRMENNTEVRRPPSFLLLGRGRHDHDGRRRRRRRRVLRGAVAAVARVVLLVVFLVGEGGWWVSFLLIARERQREEGGRGEAVSRPRRRAVPPHAAAAVKEHARAPS